MNRDISSVAVIGLGKLGLPLAVAFAGAGLRVVGVDRDPALVAALEAGGLPSSEPGLRERLGQALHGLEVSRDPAAGADCDATVFMLPTPSDPHTGRYDAGLLGEAVNSRARAVARCGGAGGHLGSHIGDHLFVVGCTVMPGTVGGDVRAALLAGLGGPPPSEINLAYSPEFVALGSVLRDYETPDMILIGAPNRDIGLRAASLYRRIAINDPPVEILSILDAEIAKTALNGYLCQKISFGNFLSQYCAARGGGDPRAIARAIGRDSRIGQAYLAPGMPYGGPCFSRDVAAFRAMSAEVGLDAPHLEAADRLNELQADLVAKRALMAGDGAIAIFGVSFKPGSPVCDESPSIALAERLLAAGRQVLLWDPDPETRTKLPPDRAQGAQWRDTPEDCENADCVVIAHPNRRLRERVYEIFPERRRVDPWG